ncbi:MAG: hypothetical protein WC975_09460 [Phycisphaerae bacterium]
MNNLNDNQIEALLRRFGPKGPPTALRKKIFESPKTHYSFRSIFWWSSIAAMLIISLCLNFAADGVAKDTAKLLGPSQTQWTPEAEEAAKLLDGNGWGRRYIAFALEMDKRNRKNFSELDPL